VKQKVRTVLRRAQGIIVTNHISGICSHLLRFEFLMAMSMKVGVFWNVVAYDLVDTD
jgi:hypothetical protein